MYCWCALISAPPSVPRTRDVTPARTGIKRYPFHSSSTFDTVPRAELAFAQTVLSRAVQAAGLSCDSAEAHSASYDREQAAELFRTVLNRWDDLRGSKNRCSKR